MHMVTRVLYYIHNYPQTSVNLSICAHAVALGLLCWWLLHYTCERKV